MMTFLFFAGVGQKMSVVRTAVLISLLGKVKLSAERMICEAKTTSHYVCVSMRPSGERIGSASDTAQYLCCA